MNQPSSASSPNTADSIVSVSDYLSRGRYIVPSYQRGYKWSLLTCSSGKTHLQQLLLDLLQAYDSKVPEYHLQGVTVKAEGDRFELIDGQQRSTSLYLILLRARNKGVNIDEALLRDRLDYQVRAEVKAWLHGRFNKDTIHPNREIQDIAAMEAAWHQIGVALDPRDDLASFIDFLLTKVKIIVLTIDSGLLPTQVFSMMNRDKAVMTKTDLIKARLLFEVSRIGLDSKDAATEIQVSQRRSQLAHEWDRWRLWWADKAHAKFYGHGGALTCPEGEPDMARLLRWYVGDKGEVDLYTAFESKLAEGAQAVFDQLHEWQEVLQEWYESPKIHNAIGLLLFGGIGDRAKRLTALRDRYLQGNKAAFVEEVRDLAEWSLVTSESDPTKRSSDAKSVLSGLLVDGVYNGEAKEDAFRQLLRMNIALLPPTEKFPFLACQSDRSLEHIHPKSRVVTKDSKVYANDEAETAETSVSKAPDGYLDFRDEPKGNGISEHCIGNLVLLLKRDNSAVGIKDLDEKRRIIFDRLNRSSLLLHTLKVIAGHAEWNIDQIRTNRDDFEKNFRSCYRAIASVK
jgi:Protein of unknown function DUF262/Protein of unknown function (DUF1524)